MAQLKIISRVSLLIILFVLGALSFWAVGRVKKEVELFRHIALEKLVWSAEINADQAEGYARTLMLLTSTDPAMRAQLHAEIQHFREKTDRAIQTYPLDKSTAESRSRLETLNAKRKRYQEIREQTIQFSDQGRRDDALALAQMALWPAYKEYTAAGDELLTYDRSAAKAYAEDIRRVCTISQYLAVAISVIGFIGGIAVPFILMWFSHGRREAL